MKLPTRNTNPTHPGASGIRNHWQCFKAQKTLSMTTDAMNDLAKLVEENGFSGESEVIEVLIRVALQEALDLDAIRAELLKEIKK